MSDEKGMRRRKSLDEILQEVLENSPPKINKQVVKKIIAKKTGIPWKVER